MEIKKGQEQAYADWKAKNQDDYSAVVFVYAEEWANAMEEKLSQGQCGCPQCRWEVKEIAEELEPQGHGITGFQYGCVIGVLSEVWEHGEELRVWHNSKYNGGEKAKGVINPALMVISDG